VRHHRLDQRTVQFAAAFAKLQHIAEHCDSLASARPFRERIERRAD